MAPTNLAGPLVIPGDEEKRRTEEEMRRRETEIGGLKTAIQAMESQQLQRDCDEENVSVRCWTSSTHK